MSDARDHSRADIYYPGTVSLSGLHQLLPQHALLRAKLIVVALPAVNEGVSQYSVADSFATSSLRTDSRGFVQIQ